VQTIQDNNSVAVVLVANPDLQTPNYSIRRIRDDEAGLPENSATIYKLVTPKEDPSLPFEEIKRPAQRTEAAVSNVLPLTPAPQPVEPEEPKPAAANGPGLLQRFFGWMKPAAPPPAPERTERPRSESRGSGGSSRGRDRGERDRGRGEERRGRDRNRNEQQRRRRRAEGGSGGSNGAANAAPRERAPSGGGSGRSRRSRNRRGGQRGQQQQQQEESRGNGQDVAARDDIDRRSEGNGSAGAPTTVENRSELAPPPAPPRV